MNFMYPDRLMWLVLAAIFAASYGVAIIRGRIRRTKTNSALERILPKRGAWKRHLAVFAALLSIVTLNIAYAVPSTEVDVPRERATVVIAIDVSRSMNAEDVKPNRITAAKDSAITFVRSMPKGFNVALVAFAGTSSILVPPTTDHQLVISGINNLELAPSTAIGEAVYSGLKAVKQAPPDPDHPDKPAPAAIVLLSDGKTNIGRPSDKAAADAKKLGVPVYTIAYGTPGGYLEINGRRQPVPVDYNELRQVSVISGGQAFKAGSVEELQSVYKSLSQVVGYEKQLKPVTERYAGYALIFAVASVLAVASLAARWP